jgi:hypothetical protein
VFVADSVTVPVGAMVCPFGSFGAPVAPPTVTVTLSVLLELMLVGLGVTVIVGAAEPGVTAVQAFTTLATFSEPRPVARSKPVVAL